MLPLIFICGISLKPGTLPAQNFPEPFGCGTPESNSSGGFSTTCPHTSQYWSNNTKYLPTGDYAPLKIRVNLVIIQRQDGSGNFQDNATDRQFLTNMINVTNQTYEALIDRNEDYYPGQNLPFLPNVKVEFIPNFIFIKDEYGWNNRNDYNTSGVPYLSNWYLNYLDNQIYNNPSSPKAINLYFSNDGYLHEQMVVLGTTTDYEGNIFFRNHSASEIPGLTNINPNDFHSMRCHIANVWLKLWWFKNVLGYTDSAMELEAGKSIAHELGHLMALSHTPSSHVHSIMNTSFGGNRDYMTTNEIGRIHRAFGLYPSLWQFVDCDATYVSTAANRIVLTNETWDLTMRLYTNVVVKTGSTLTITCDILMPYDGTITVERGARLIVDGGIVRRANTCTPTQFWRGVIAQGNNTLPQPNPAGSSTFNQGSVILLKGQGMIEGAVIGVAAKGHPIWDVPEFRGALVQANDFTFRNCRKGVEFMKYDFVNNSKFDNTLFERTSTGSMHTGVSIWDTDGILFERCTFQNMSSNGIIALDAIFNVKQKNRFRGSDIAVFTGASMPLLGQIQVGMLGLQGDDRNKFENNTVGIRATANSKVEIFSNDFNNFDFDVAINGATQSALTDNLFASETAGNQFENTGDNKNENLCNNYQGNIVGTNIVGKNTGFLFREEDFATNIHDLFIEGAQTAPGAIQFFQGNNGSARWNYFSANKAENIKTSTVQPNNNTSPFFYFHPDPSINNRLKPKCALNDACIPHSNFTNQQTNGFGFNNCMFPNPPQEPCRTKPCLDVVRQQIAQKSAQYSASPTTELAAELQSLVTLREFIVDGLIIEHLAQNDWSGVEVLLNEDLNPANHRRLVGATLEQKMFPAALAMLQSFPQNTIDDQYFVQVQNINAARFSDPQFLLSNTQEQTLLNVATATSPEAGYAQSLLNILTGRVFMPQVPALGEARNSQLPNNLLSAGTMQVSPNPVGDVLQVQLSPGEIVFGERILELRSIASGELVRMISVPDGNVLSISVSTLPAGMYLLTLRNQGVAQSRQQIVIQH
jgi:hypothetical protein